MQANEIFCIQHLGSCHLISAMGVLKYLRTKPTACQLTLDYLPHNTCRSSANELHTNQRLEGTQEGNNKSGHPIGEYIVIGEFAKTM